MHKGNSTGGIGRGKIPSKFNFLKIYIVSPPPVYAVMYLKGNTIEIIIEKTEHDNGMKS